MLALKSTSEISEVVGPVTIHLIKKFPEFKEMLLEFDQLRKNSEKKYDSFVNALDPQFFLSRKDTIIKAFKIAKLNNLECNFDRIDNDTELMLSMKSIIKSILCVQFYELGLNGICSTCKRSFETHFDKLENNLLTLIIEICNVLPYFKEMFDQYETHFNKIKQDYVKDNIFLVEKINFIKQLREAQFEYYTCPDLIQMVSLCETELEIKKTTKMFLVELFCSTGRYPTENDYKFAEILVGLCPELKDMYEGIK